MKELKLLRMLATFALALLAVLTLAACGGGDPESHTFELSVTSTTLLKGVTPIQVKQGDTVTLDVSMDDALTFHLHGYDIEVEGGPGEHAVLNFVADATGSFPFTVHAVEEHEEGGDHEHEEEEEVELGRLEVLPR